jgi:hypothetical protein
VSHSGLGDSYSALGSTDGDCSPFWRGNGSDVPSRQGSAIVSTVDARELYFHFDSIQSFNPLRALRLTRAQDPDMTTSYVVKVALHSGGVMDILVRQTFYRVYKSKADVKKQGKKKQGNRKK